MRIFSNVSLFALLAISLLFVASCGDDTPGVPGSVTLGPLISLNVDSDFISADETRPFNNDPLRFSLSLQDGDAPLRDLTILEDGVTIPASRIGLDGIPTANNPQLITGADQNGYTQNVTITPDVTIPGDVTYTFRVTDSDNESAETSITITYEQNAAEVSLGIEDGVISADTMLGGGPFEVVFNAAAVDGDLVTLEVNQDGQLVPAEDITFLDTPNFTGTNPYTFIQGEERNASIRMRITPDTDGLDETTPSTFTFDVTDSNGQVGSTSLTLTFVPTALTFDTTGVFFNASGSRDGGLDLDTGEAVDFNSDDAELQDEGINLNAAAGTENWRRQISGENDVTIRLVDFNAVNENLNFDNVTTADEIALLLDAGSELDGEDNFPNTDGDTSSDEEVSQPLNGGEVFAIQRDDRVYLVRIDEVNAVALSNNDSYTVSIKY